MKRNIFSYATSELSQDAFIGWLMSYGNEEGKKIDRTIYECAHTMLMKFYPKDKMPKKAEVKEVLMQKNKVDVTLYVEDDFGSAVFIIEDKTRSIQGEEQLETYYKKAVEEYTEKRVYGIYFKSFLQGNIHTIINSEFKPFLLYNIVETLQETIPTLNYLEGKYGIGNILYDYCEHYYDLYEKMRKYSQIDVSQWDEEQIVAFMYEMCKNPESAYDFGELNNGHGNFWGLWEKDEDRIIMDELEELKESKEEKTVCTTIYT
ncbi:MAG: hypothetical protein GX786_03765, partial [Clostridiales bacterium]|nr:hypothetical protein [Clostridiales bacterium]